MLRRLRALPDIESDEALELREVIVLTINGCRCLRNTGEWKFKQALRFHVKYFL